MKAIVIGKIDNIPVIHFNVLEDWESFNTIINMLVSRFSAVVTTGTELPESKFCKLSIGEANFTLINDPYGNTLRSDNKKADELIYKIYNDWSKDS